MTTSSNSGEPAGDTLLGVCAAIGECLGIPALLPRLMLVAAVLAGAFETTMLGYGLAALVIHAARPWTTAPFRRGLTMQASTS